MVAALSFVEILLPGGHMGKYLKFILALILLAVLVYPLANLGKGEIQVFTGESYTSQGVPVAPDRGEVLLESIRTKQILEVYKEKLARHIEELAAGEISGIEVYVTNIYINSNKNSGSRARVEEVVVRINDPDLTERFKSLVSAELGLRRGQIKVIYEKEGDST